MRNIRRDQQQVGTMNIRWRSLKENRPIQPKSDLRRVVPVPMRNITGSQQQQALRPNVLRPNIQLKRRRGHISQFIQARPGPRRVRSRL